MTDDLPRGAVLALAIAQAAGKAGVPISQYARPLSRDPAKWLRQLSTAKAPKLVTVQRIEALIAGREVPPPPPNNFQAAPRKRPVLPRRAPQPIAPSEPVSRDPCFRCGVRGDIGCNCGARQ